MASKRGATNRTGPRRAGEGRDEALFVISVAAELAGVHPQTLRMYERKGLVRPARTSGRVRRYSMGDIERVRVIQALTQDQGMNLAGVEVVMDLRRELEAARARFAALQHDMEVLRQRMVAEVERVRRSFRRDLMPIQKDIVPFRRGGGS